MMSSCLPMVSRFFYRPKRAAKELPPASPLPPPPKTYIYSTPVPGVELCVDVYLPATPLAGWPSPTILFFHGGGLLYGARDIISRALCEDALKRNWSFLSYDYRKLSPCSGHDILTDLHAAFTHYHTTLVPAHNLSATNIFVAGYSSGGYLAQLAGVHWEPKPLGLFLVAAQGGKLLSDGYYGVKGEPQELGELPEACRRYLSIPAAEGARVVGPLSQSGEDEEEFRARLQLAGEMWRRGIRLDLLTGIPGLSAQLREYAAEASGGLCLAHIIPHSARPLFPELTLDESFPPSYIVHGDADTTVLPEESFALKERLKRKNVPCELVLVKDATHAALAGDMVYREYMAGVMRFFEGRLVGDEEEEEVV
ncbi:Alpha/Beta hydrolase protein [Sphaerosporella brunnea]|uniref:Alpha/Beta hydrolase protein n=1 Tax=Sphaerosporella brunnea TaxID=1250544 RepID=A0A5J5FAL7_9PEZI|nr:Alpha/Beta hydrolase protein [Sphaerosporella brunnea]